LLKSELLKAIQSEINRHGLDTFPVRVDNGNIVTPGCPACRKTLYTTSNFIDHINNDVLPALLDRLSKSENAELPDEDFIDTDYWADPERKIRRKSGEQETILTATGACSKVEWMMLLAGLGMIDPDSASNSF
jgi:hypothetical protein